MAPTNEPLSCSCASDGRSTTVSDARRAFLSKAAVGAVAAWTVPTLASVPAHAQASPTGRMFGSTARALSSVDLTTGAWTLIGPYGFSFAATGIAYDSTADVLYGCYQAFLPDAPSTFVIDTATASWSLVGPTGLSGPEGMAYDSLTDTLYGWDDFFGLCTVDRTSGAWSAVSPLLPAAMSDMAFDPVNDVLYGTDGPTDRFSTIDPSNGAVTLIGNPGTPLPLGIGFDSNNDVMYGCDVVTNGTYTVDRSTGAWTLLGDSGTIAPRSMTFAP